MYTVQVRFTAADEELLCISSCTKEKKTTNQNCQSTNSIIANSAFPYFGMGRTFTWVTKKVDWIIWLRRSIVPLNVIFFSDKVLLSAWVLKPYTFSQNDRLLKI